MDMSSLQRGNLLPYLGKPLNKISPNQIFNATFKYYMISLTTPTFSAPNYCGEFDNAGAMMSVDETLMCSFQILKPADKKKFPYGGLNSGRPITPPRGAAQKKGKK